MLYQTYLFKTFLFVVDDQVDGRPNSDHPRNRHDDREEIRADEHLEPGKKVIKLFMDKLLVLQILLPTQYCLLTVDQR